MDVKVHAYRLMAAHCLPLAALAGGAAAGYNGECMRALIEHWIHTRITGRGVIVIVAVLLSWPYAASARSVLDGLEIVESEKGGGVEILTLAPSSPAAQALLRVGDCITSIGGEKIKNLDDYVKVSKQFKNRKGGVNIEYVRKGTRHTAELSLHSSPLHEKWGVTVAPWRESGEKKDAEYWLEQARKQIQENERTSEDELRPVNYGKVLLCLFTSLNQNPDALGTAMLIGRQYGTLAALYHRRGEKKKAIWCLRRALLIYGNGLQKAGGIQEIVLVKYGLTDLQRTLAKMQ
jgi:membrane-associated protease RseP (regulator of RpoE activity)